MSQKQVDKSTFSENVDLESLADFNDPEVEKIGDESLDDFFKDLERDVEGAIFEGPSGDPDKAQEGSRNQVAAEEGSDTELEKLKEAYSESSREAKRLKEKLQKLEAYEEYVPLLEVMREDPALIDTVTNYLQGKSASDSVTQRLQLPEDFIFDADEAIKDPTSDSGKVLAFQIDKIVDQRMRERVARESQVSEIQKQEMALMKEFDLKEGDLDDLRDWAKKRTLTLKDIYFLKNRENRDREIVRKSVDERLNKSERVSKLSPTLASMGTESSVDKKSIEDEVFSEILKAQGGLNFKAR